MANLPHPGTDDDTGGEPESATGMPRWVKVFVIAGLALVLLLAVGKLTGLGGDHGPGRHRGGDDPPVTLMDEDGGHRPPVDHGPQRGAQP
jgi:hypothetical protein